MINWIKSNYNKIIKSIAFYPAIIALLFLLLSFIFIEIDFSGFGKNLKNDFSWLQMKDPGTARVVISSIVGGIISLTVFSFTMVMIILNQTASQMSNRILDELIGNRFQQIVLGIYIGTVVFALFLLSTVRDDNSGIQTPSISIYFLIILTILDIFLFIYFLHYITQSVKYSVIINRICNETLCAMKASCESENNSTIKDFSSNHIIRSSRFGIYEGFQKEELLQAAKKHQCDIMVLVSKGRFIHKEMPVLQTSIELSPEAHSNMESLLLYVDDETIKTNFFYGFRQLTEVAIKALSPGINDPGTAVKCIRKLTELFAFRINNPPCSILTDEENKISIITNEYSVEELFTTCILPIWDYGKKDRSILQELNNLNKFISSLQNLPAVKELQAKVEAAINNF